MSRDNQQLVDYLVDSSVLKSPEIIGAFRSVDRADFVPQEHPDQAYGDYPLPIGHGQTISQPTTVAFMIELLQPRKGQKILDVGSGSGWTTAILAEFVGKKGKVWGVEVIPELVEYGQSNLKKYKLPQGKIVPAESDLGLPKEAPFDRILVSASGTSLPQPLIDQLKVGGRLVMPIGSSVWKIDKVSESKIDQEEFPSFVFVPLRE